MRIEKQKEFFFDNLIHMGFIGKVCPNSKQLLITGVNNQLRQRLIDIGFDIKKVDEGKTNIASIIRAVFSEEHFIDEYLTILSYLVHSKYDKVKNIDLAHFVISKVSAIGNNGFSMKSTSPEGNLTSLIPFDYYKNDPAIYADAFTVPQYDRSHNKVVGFQGIFPIANTRRETFLKGKKDSELHIFHNLISDMPNRSTSILKSIEKKQSVSKKIKYRLRAVTEYLDNLFLQSKRTLELFSMIAYSNESIKNTNVLDLYNHALHFKKILHEKDFCLNVKFDKAINEMETLFSREGLEFIITQIVENAIKEYKVQEVNEMEQSVTVNFTKVTLNDRDTLKISVVSHSLFIHDETIIDNAGKRPLSTNSTGLGFYFMNTVLELLKANLPPIDQGRHFDLISNEHGVLFNIYFYKR